MKIISIFLAAILAYSGFWYLKEKDAKKRIEVLLKEAEEPGPDGYALQYTGLKMGGYPLAYEAQIKKPRYALKKPLNGQKSAEIFVDGIVTLGENILGDKSWIERNGDVHILPNFESDEEEEKGPNEHFLVTGHSKFTIQSKEYHPFDGFENSIKKFKNLWNEENSIDQFVQSISNLNFDANNVSFFEMNKHSNKLFAFDRFHTNISHAKKNDQFHQINFDFSVKGLEIFKGAMEYSLGGTPDSYLTMNFGGKTDSNIKGYLVVPEDVNSLNKLPFSDWPGFEFHIDDASHSNNFGHSDFETAFIYGPKTSDVRNVHFDLKTSLETTEKHYNEFYKLFKAYLEDQAKNPSNTHVALKFDIIEDPQKSPASLQINQKQLEKVLACCEEDLKKVIPKLYEQGKIKFNLDSDLTINDEQNSGTALVKHFDLTSDLYGVKTSGNIQFIHEEVKGKYVLNFINYEQMFHDIYTYYNQIRFLINILEDDQNESNFPLISEKMEKDFLQYIKEISDDPQSNSKDLTITIDFPTSQQIKIGTLDMPQFMQRTMQYQGEIQHELQ